MRGLRRLGPYPPFASVAKLRLSLSLTMTGEEPDPTEAKTATGKTTAHLPKLQAQSHIYRAPGTGGLKGGVGPTGREPRMCSDEQGGLGSK